MWTCVHTPVTVIRPVGTRSKAAPRREALAISLGTSGGDAIYVADSIRKEIVADLSAYPQLVVIYLGMRVYRWRGLRTVLRVRSEIHKALAQNLDGLLFHESFYFSLLPLHIGLRQYWRDFDSLDR
jgi:hypothetical protein